MRNPFKRKPKPYVTERNRLQEWLGANDPTHEDYATVMARLTELDKLIKRASETKKAVIPAVGTGVSILGIYALQQFGGVLVPKVLEAHAARKEQKNNNDQD